VLIDYSHRAKVTRRVTVNSDGTFSPVDLPSEPEFRLELRSPTRPVLRDLESPRDLRAYDVRYRSGVIGPAGGPLNAGSRLTIDEAPWEVLDKPHELLLGRRVEGYAQRIQPLHTLYPFVGEVQELDTTTNIRSIILSLWSSSDTHNNVGEYESRNGEVPIEHLDVLKLNRFIKVGTKLWKITSVAPDIEYPHVAITVRLSK